MNDNIFNKITSSVIELIKDNKNIFIKLNKEDNEVNQFYFEIDQLIEILKKYKNTKTIKVERKKFLVNHYGNPYITAMLCVESLMNNAEIIIGIEDFCYGINKAIINIFNDVLKSYKIDMQILLKIIY